MFGGQGEIRQKLSNWREHPTDTYGMGNKVWVVQPLSDGSCRVFEVNTLPDGTFTVSKPWLHWTAMLLFGDPAYRDSEDGLELEDDDPQPNDLEQLGEASPLRVFAPGKLD